MTEIASSFLSRTPRSGERRERVVGVLDVVNGRVGVATVAELQKREANRNRVAAERGRPMPARGEFTFNNK